MTSPSKRRDTDIMKLMLSNYQVVLGDQKDFYVKFPGPKESAFEGGFWKVHVVLPQNYPYKSPSIGFCNKIYHPNIDQASGSVCLDVINQTWSPMYDLVNVFAVFLPQLLLYPNPSDPLNGEAAALLLSNPKAYAARVQEFVKKYASVEFNLDGDDDEEPNSSGTTSTSTSISESSTPSTGRSTTRISTDSESSVSSDDSNDGMTTSATSSSIAIKTTRGKDMTDDDLSGSSGDRKEEEEQLSDMDDDGLTGGIGDSETGGEIGNFELDQVNTEGELTDQMEF